MYKCLECGAIFHENEIYVYYEKHGLDTPPYETITGCPVCHGTYEEMSSCVLCDCDIDNTDGGYCENCKNDVKERFIKMLHSEFDDEEIKLLNIIYECEELK